MATSSCNHQFPKSALETMEGANSFGRELHESMSTNGDVTFLVGPKDKEEEIKSSVLVLRTFSTVFDTQFNEKWKSQQQAIRLPDIFPKIFRVFIKILFLDMNLNSGHFLNSPELDLSIEDILHLLYIATKFEVNSIQSFCRTLIKSRMDLKNIVLVYETLQKMNEPELEKKSFDFIITNFDRLLEEDSFIDFSIHSLTGFLKSDELFVPEFSLFKGICRWAESTSKKQQEMKMCGGNERKLLGDLSALLRLRLRNIQDFYETVEPTGFFNLEEIVRICEPSEVPLSLVVVEKPRILDNCFVYIPDQRTVVSVVRVDSLCACCRDQGYGKCRCHYSLKFCIFDEELGNEIVPLTWENAWSCLHLLFVLKKRVTFTPGKKYNIYYELQKKGVAPRAIVSVKGVSLTFRTFPHRY